MKTYIFTRIALILLFLLCSLISSQEFDTGKIGASLSDAGRLRIGAPTLTEKRQIDRSSVIFAASESAVFAYNPDADSMIMVHNVEGPLKSDFELFGIADNSWSDNPPDIEVKMNIYGWTDKGFIIARFGIVNKESTTLNGRIAMEIIPQVDGEYGLESTDHNSGIAFTYRRPSITVPTTTYTGYKILSTAMTTQKTIDWFDGYDSLDAPLYGWCTAGTIQTRLFETGSDGAVMFISADPVDIEPEGVAEIYIAVAVGSDESEMKDNMNDAVAHYGPLTSVKRDENLIAESFELSQNYPNPFNPSTLITFSIPEEGHVSLRIYNSVGELIEEAVNKNMSRGVYSYHFDASDLTSGVYYYTLTSGANMISKKMLLLK